MLRKSVILSSFFLFIILRLAFGLDGPIYLKTSIRKVQATIDRFAPIECKIDRAHKMILELEQQINRQGNFIEEQEIESEQLTGRIRSMEAKLTAQRAVIIRENEMVDASNLALNVSNQLDAELVGRLSEFRAKCSTLQKLQELSKAKHNALAAAQHRLAGMAASKRQLEAHIENLEARNQMLAFSRENDAMHLNDGIISRTRRLIGEIEVHIKVAERIVDANSGNTVPLDEPTIELPQSPMPRNSVSESIIESSDDQAAEFTGNKNGIARHAIRDDREVVGDAMSSLREASDARMATNQSNNCARNASNRDQPRDLTQDLLQETRFRRWKDRSGRYSTRGRLVAVTAHRVRILKENGRYATVNKSRLSQLDQRYVRSAIGSIPVDK